jgi:hypothetical protein
MVSKKIQETLKNDDDLKRQLKELGKARQHFGSILDGVTDPLASTRLVTASKDLDSKLEAVSDTLGLTRRFFFPTFCPNPEDEDS